MITVIQEEDRQLFPKNGSDCCFCLILTGTSAILAKGIYSILLRHNLKRILN